MDTKVLTIKTIDNKIEHEIKSVRIFTLKYSRKIGKNEFHAPRVARLIVDTEEKMYQYLIATPIINSDAKGNIYIYSSYEFDKLAFKKPYFDDHQLEVATQRVAYFSAKNNFHLDTDEVVSFQKAKMILDLNKVMKLKLDYEKGGGF